MDMNFFEQELKKLTGYITDLTDKKYVGRACFGKLTENLRVRMELITQGWADHYTAVKATIINRNDGPVDVLTLRFSDLLGKKTVNNPNFSNGIYPYIWNSGDSIEWYVYHPSKADYKQISEALNDYLDMFRCPALEMEQTETTMGGQRM
jgi:hypothetical protein